MICIGPEVQVLYYIGPVLNYDYYAYYNLCIFQKVIPDRAFILELAPPLDHDLDEVAAILCT